MSVLHDRLRKIERSNLLTDSKLGFVNSSLEGLHYSFSWQLFGLILGVVVLLVFSYIKFTDFFGTRLVSEAEAAILEVGSDVNLVSGAGDNSFSGDNNVFAVVKKINFCKQAYRAYVSGNYQYAEQILLDGLGSDPQNIGAKDLLLNVYLQTKDWSKANNLILKFIHDDNMVAKLGMTMAHIFLEQKQHHRALQVVNQYEIGSDADLLKVYLLKSSIYREIHEYGKAANYLQYFLAMEPEYGEAWVALGICYEQLSDMESAKLAYNRSIHLLSSKPDLYHFAVKRLKRMRS